MPGVLQPPPAVAPVAPGGGTDHVQPRPFGARRVVRKVRRSRSANRGRRKRPAR